MLTIPGYRVGEQLYESANSQVYRARREVDECPVVLKVLKGVYPSPERVAWFRREYRVTSSIDLPGAIGAYSLETIQNRWIMILQDFGGDSLTRLDVAGKMALLEFLALAIKITDALGQIHDENIIHKDINPSNIVYNPTTSQVKLIDFGIATMLSQESPTFRTPNALEGSLAYISPEQTGRMNRVLDYRTDFYSLGVTFYELLMGHLPYDTDDPLELVHAHMAKIPTPPDTLRADISPTLSKAILKLMSKNAQDRYQSAYGLRADLARCLANVQKTPEIPCTFEVGQNDRSGRFRIPSKLYGREHEIETLMQAFERVSSGGQVELLLVTGYAGVGKSSLVHETHKPITAKRGMFVSGKHDHYQHHIPFSAFSLALSEFCCHLLTESAETLAAWKARILEAVGNNGQVLVDVIPNLELVIGQQPPVEQVGPQESQNRFVMVFQAFVAAISRADHPLVLFIDDLQWADIASLDLLKKLAADDENRYLLMIGAYRDNEVDATHPLIRIVEAIENAGAVVNTLYLGNLIRHDVNELLSETLSSTLAQVQPLADLVYERTRGNAFFTIELIKSLYEEGVLVFASAGEEGQGAWQWDLDAIAAKEITANVVELMAGRIERLPDPTQQILQLAACIGSSFDLKTLAVVAKKNQREASDDLWPALQVGLVLPIGDAYKFAHDEMLPDPGPAAEKEPGVRAGVSYKFLHDRVQQATYSLIPEADRQVVHLEIGRLMLENTPPKQLDEALFDIVNQLNVGAELIAGPAERQRLAGLNLGAGRKAKASAAYEAATHYLGQGMGLLEPNSWKTQYATTCELCLELAECEYLDSNFEAAEQLLDVLFDRVQTNIELANVYQLKLVLHVTKGEIAEGISAALECLESFDIHLPADPSHEQAEQAYEEVWTSLSSAGLQPEDLLDLPLMTDASMQAVMKVLEASALPAHFATEFLMYLILARMVTLSITYGNTDESVVGYTIFAVTLCSRGFDRYQEGYRFGQLGYDLMEKLGLSRLRGQVHTILNNVIPYSRHFINCRDYLYTGIQAGQESGNLAYSSHACSHLVANMLTVGDPLDEVWRESGRGLEFVRRVQDPAAEKFIIAQQRLILNLQGLTASWSTFSDDHFDQGEFEAQIAAEQVPIVLYWYHIFKMIPRFIFGDYEQAAEAFESAREVMWVERWDPVSTLYFYFAALTLAVQYDSVSSQKQNEYLETLIAYQEQIRLWAESCPENFANRYALVSAEVARIKGDDLEAMHLYEQAIQSARENGFIQNAGIGNELASRFYRDRGFATIANAYLKEAWYCYLQWGAVGKVKQLEQAYPHLREPMHPSMMAAPAGRMSPAETPTVWGLDLDVNALMKASQAISGEIVLDNLIATLMQIALEDAGAERGCLILEHNGQLAIEAIGTAGEVETAVHPTPLCEADDQLSVAMVRYAIRTRQSVVLHDAANEGLFTEDSYVMAHQSKSVLCMPLVHQGQARGALYLENDLSTGAFTPDRLQVLSLLSSQAAISIENARLYNTLEQKVSERTCELRQSNERLRQEIAERKRTEKELWQAKEDAERSRYVTEEARATAEQAHAAAEEARAAAEEARTAAEAANQAKSIFLANMSHELRTPLNAILGFSQVMGHTPELTPGQRENLETISRSGEHLLGLINDVLELSKIEAGRVELHRKRFDLWHMLLGLDEMFRLRAQSKGLTLVFERTANVPQYVRADAGKLRQVIINLLGNAVKFTHEGQITLRVKRARAPGAPGEPERSTVATRLVFEVQDTGIGIAPDETDAIFEPFFQTESGRQAQEGTGLGLHISQQFVRMMGGDIGVRSELGKGTLFWFDLPFELVETDEVPVTKPGRQVVGLEPGQRAADGGPYRLLIAEDVAANRRLLILLLKPLTDPAGNPGFEVREAANGQEAIDLWQQWHPHLIWMDLRMPVVDGYKATQRIRAMAGEQGASAPPVVIVALTGKSFEEDRQEILAQGFDDFIRKPIHQTQIFDALTRHLGVQFAYEHPEHEEPEQKGVHPCLVPADLATLPPDLLNRLEQALVRIDMALIDALMDEVRTHNTTLADALAGLARNFQYDEMLNALRQAKDTQ